MSEHIWATEHLAAYVTDGLSAAERERVELHAAECSTCAHALADFSSLDERIDTLFAGERPTPALEDRMIRTLRLHRPRKNWSIALRFAASIAALLVLGVIGTVGSSLLAGGDLRFPGTRDNSEYRDVVAMVGETETGSIGWGRGSGSGEGRGQGPGGKVGSMATITSGLVANDETVKKLELAEKSLAEARERYMAQEQLYKGGGYSKGGATSKEDYRAATKLFEEKRKEVDELKAQQTHGYPAGRGTPTNRKTPDLPMSLPDPQSWQSATTPAPDAKSLSAQPEGERGKKVDPAPAVNAPPAAEPMPVTPGRPTVGIQGAVGSPLEDKSPDQSQDNKAPEQPPAVGRRVIIRSGDIEFEITSFDDAVATITRLVGGDKGGFIATVNSEKLPNGKVRGAVVVRVPPERLDSLVLELRKELGKVGELKSQRIGSQDITKQYTDLESRLRAARAMEERLLKIIKDGTGQIKDLIAAEKELGNWRTKIEEFEGELRYYANLVSLSTLTITLYEKEIRAAASIKETEKVDMGIEVEDVEKAHRDALAAITAAKGRVSKAELKQLGAGQFSASIQFEADPESAGPLRDRLKQLGNVARLQIDRVRQPQGGSGQPTDGKVDRVDTHFTVSLYNLTGLVPREVVNLRLVAPDAEATYKAALARAQKATGRIITSNLNRQRSDQTNGTIQFEAKSTEADAVLADLRALGEVMLLQFKENQDAPNVTRTKQGFVVEVWSLGAVQPRETVSLDLAMRDVPKGYRTLQDAVAKSQGRVINAQLNEQDRTSVTGELDFEVRRADEDAVRAALEAAGDVYSRNVTRSPDAENVIDSKVRWRVKLINVNAIPPSETVSLGIEVKEVEQASAALSAYVNEVKGRTVDSSLTHETSGRIRAKLKYDVPLAAAPGVIEKFKAVGVVRQQQVQRNPQARESELATARLDVELSNEERIVRKDEGLWTQVRKGLATSFTAISLSVVVVIIGLCFVLPWAVVLYAGYLIFRRFWRRPVTEQVPS